MIHPMGSDFAFFSIYVHKRFRPVLLRASHVCRAPIRPKLINSLLLWVCGCNPSARTLALNLAPRTLDRTMAQFPSLRGFQRTSGMNVGDFCMALNQVMRPEFVERSLLRISVFSYVLRRTKQERQPRDETDLSVSHTRLYAFSVSVLRRRRLGCFSKCFFFYNHCGPCVCVG